MSATLPGVRSPQQRRQDAHEARLKRHTEIIQAHMGKGDWVIERDDDGKPARLHWVAPESP